MDERCNLVKVKSQQNIKLHQNHSKGKQNLAHQLCGLRISQKTLLVILTFVDCDKCSGRAQLIKCIDFPQDDYISWGQFSRINLIWKDGANLSVLESRFESALYSCICNIWEEVEGAQGSWKAQLLLHFTANVTCVGGKFKQTFADLNCVGGRL